MGDRTVKPINNKGKMNHTRQKATWEEDKTKRFINPYNFIPLEGSVTRFPYTIDYKNTHTGYFECRLEVLTPLIIPNTSCDKALHSQQELEAERGYEDRKKSKSWDFFSYNTLKENNSVIYEPVIPGSEIRGVVRSVYEAAFQGCMSVVSGNKILGRRWPGPKLPGILEKKEEDKWMLTPCSRYPFQGSIDQLKEGQKIYGRIVNYNGQELFRKTVVQEGLQDRIKNGKHSNLVEGYFHVGEKFTNHVTRSVFVKDSMKKPICVLQEDIDALKRVLEEYRDPKMNRKLQQGEHTGYQHYDLNQKVLPVYYINYSNMPLYLSPACIGKEVFRKTVVTLLKNNGGFQPCTKTDEVCSACALFGMVSGEKGRSSAIGSRLRFTDAILEEKPEDGKYDKYYMNPVLLPELGEPKPGTVEFYTYPPYDKASLHGWNNSQGYWTYDYMCTKRDKLFERVELSPDQPRLRGRKYYWHSDEWINYMHDGKLTSMRQRVRPLRSESGTYFKFKVYFENLTDQELERVKWSLDFDDSQCAHKMGRAKPLGFGSVKIHVDALYFRNLNAENGSWDLNVQDLSLYKGRNIDENTKAIQTLRLMANWEERYGKSGDKSGMRVCYPLGEDNPYNNSNGSQKNRAVSHQWFNGNRNGSGDSKNMQPAFSKVLPEALKEVTQEDKWLFKLEKIIKKE